MSRHAEEEKLVAQIEADLDDPDAWVDDDPAPEQPRALGAVISLRLKAELANDVRAIAESRGVRYTALIRTWVHERVEQEKAAFAVTTKPTISSYTERDGAETRSREFVAHPAA